MNEILGERTVMIIENDIIYGTWDDACYDSYRNTLIELREEDYCQFTMGLLPNMSATRFLGIRIPILRKIAKEILRGDYHDYISQCISRHNLRREEVYFEETMIFGFVIASMKDIEEVMRLTSYYVTLIDNWSICDSFCISLKGIKENQEYCIPYIRTWLNQGKEFTVRAACVMLLNFYICDEYIDEVLERMVLLQSEDYYVNMAIAWNLSMCYISYPEKTLKAFESGRMNDFTYNKTLQKICESNQVSKEEKARVRLLRR